MLLLNFVVDPAIACTAYVIHTYSVLLNYDEGARALQTYFHSGKPIPPSGSGPKPSHCKVHPKRPHVLIHLSTSTFRHSKPPAATLPRTTLQRPPRPPQAATPEVFLAASAGHVEERTWPPTVWVNICSAAAPLASVPLAKSPMLCPLFRARSRSETKRNAERAGGNAEGKREWGTRAVAGVSAVGGGEKGKEREGDSRALEADVREGGERLEHADALPPDVVVLELGEVEVLRRGRVELLRERLRGHVVPVEVLRVHGCGC